MLKKTITYKDFDENPVTRDFWFHLTKAEIAEHLIAKGEGFEKYLNGIASTNDMAKILPLFKEIIALTVGERDEENRRFVKSPEITNSFMASEAYSELFFEFMTDVSAFVQFIQGVVPKDFAEKVDFTTGKLKVQEDAAIARPIEDVELPKEKAWDDFTADEVMAMSQADFDKLTTGDPRKMTHEQLQYAYRRSTRPITPKE
jgi:hypothetical protein